MPHGWTSSQSFGEDVAPNPSIASSSFGADGEVRGVEEGDRRGGGRQGRDVRGGGFLSTIFCRFDCSAVL